MYLLEVKPNIHSQLFLSTMMEFLNVWRSGEESSLSLQCKEGKKVLNLQVKAAQTSLTSVKATSVTATPARNPREESRRTTPGQQRLLRQFLLDPQPLQLSFLMSLPLQPANYFKPFYPPPPYIPGCYQPGPLPRNHHKIRKEEESVGAVRVEQHSGGTERDFSSPGEPEQEVSQSNLQRYRENLQRFQEIYGKED